MLSGITSMTNIKMARYLRSNNPGLRFLIDYWQKYCTLDDWHINWARRYLTVMPRLRKGDQLYRTGEPQQYVYFVVRGMLGRTQDLPDSDKRQLLSIALPGMALMTTAHLYSPTPSQGDITVLHPQTIVIQMPYRVIKDFKTQEPQLNTLISVLANKKTKQMSALSWIMHEQDPVARYLLFARHMSDLETVLTQQEQAELLGISKNTVQRAQYLLVKGKLPRY